MDEIAGGGDESSGGSVWFRGEECGESVDGGERRGVIKIEREGEYGGGSEE